MLSQDPEQRKAPSKIIQRQEGHILRQSALIMTQILLLTTLESKLPHQISKGPLIA